MLSAHGVEFLLVGGQAVIAHGYPRLTKDMDLWVRPTAENGSRVLAALAEFGAAPEALHAEQFEDPRTLLMLGRDPFRIDILTDIPGVTFEGAWERRISAGELERARRAADELSQIAATFESNALVASATLARARVLLADGRPGDARTSFEQAARLWNEIQAPYETARARMGLAAAHRAAGNEQLAGLELRAARATLAKLGAESHAEPEPAPQTEPQLHSTKEAFRCEGDTWWLAFVGRGVRLHDLKGLRYLARLLADPGREFHVLELVALEREPLAPTSEPSGHELGVSSEGDSGPLLDARAKEAYRRRLTEIEEDIAEATSMADLGRIAQAEAEREFLVRELSRAVGLGGRDRRAGSASERARASVTRAVRQALARIREHHVPLADHLEQLVRTGTHCAYLSDPRVPVTWTL